MKIVKLSSKGWCTMNLEKVVCDCMNVTNGQVKDAVYAGASTLSEVMDTTGAGTVCGACEANIEHMLEEFGRERDNK